MIEVAAAVIEQDGRYLITQRGQGSHLAGLWEFPGGKRHSGESLEECLRREIKEELDLQVEVGDKLDQVIYAYEDREVMLHFFRCRIIDGTPQPLEGQACCWVAPSEFPNYRFPPADSRLLRLLSSHTS